MSSFTLNDDVIRAGPNSASWSTRSIVPGHTIITIYANNVIIDITKGFSDEVSIVFGDSKTRVILINSLVSTFGVDVLVPHGLHHLLIRNQTLRFSAPDLAGVIINLLPAAGHSSTVSRVIVPSDCRPRFMAANCLWDTSSYISGDVGTCSLLSKVSTRLGPITLLNLRMCQVCDTATFLRSYVASVTFDERDERCTKHSSHKSVLDVILSIFE